MRYLKRVSVRIAMSASMAMSTLWTPLLTEAAPPVTGVRLDAGAADAHETVETILADPVFNRLCEDLLDDGLALQPQIVQSERIDGFETVFVSYSRDGRDAAGGSAKENPTGVANLGMGIVREHGEVRAVIEMRFEFLDGATRLVTEYRFAKHPDVMVSHVELFKDGNAATTTSFLGRSADGRFVPLQQRPDGSYESPDVVLSPAAIQALSFSCMKDCFWEINKPLTFAQGLCMGCCLAAAGLATVASGGTALAPVVIACLKGCGLTFLIGRAAALAVCILKCI